MSKIKEARKIIDEYERLEGAVKVIDDFIYFAERIANEYDEGIRLLATYDGINQKDLTIHNGSALYNLILNGLKEKRKKYKKELESFD